MKTLEQRFLAKVARVPSGCHEWQSTIKRDGYGQFWLIDRGIRAHRAAWIIFRGEIGSLDVLHKCDNRRCVNPDHLYLGTDHENALDKVQRFQGKWGQMKLESHEYEELARLYATGEFTQQELAVRFGIGQTAVSKAIIRVRNRIQPNI